MLEAFGIYSNTKKKLWLPHWGNGCGDEQKWLDLRDITVWKQQCWTIKVIGKGQEKLDPYLGSDLRIGLNGSTRFWIREYKE